MNSQLLIDNTINKLKQLPDDKIVIKGIQKLASDSEAFDFLKDEEDLYIVNDLKVKYK